MKRTLLVSLLCWYAGYAQVRVGAAILMNQIPSSLTGKRLGLVTNHTALLPDGTHLADALVHDRRVQLVALFGPEHGIRGDASDGRSIRNSVDSVTGLPVYSLYGDTRKPSAEMLKGVDALVFDIQDIGARFYTYESTLSLSMEAAAENGIPFVVLDRPNPIGGIVTEGFVLDDTLSSFIGLHRIRMRHGKTMGELATMINGERWLKNGVRANLTVVTMEGWKREQWYDETGLNWINPSPNMQTLRTAAVYPGTCLFEGTNCSEGRGTRHPFETIGAPFIDGKQWAADLNQRRLPGVRFSPVDFTPQEIPGVASNPKFKGELCHGVALEVVERNAFEPVRTAVAMLEVAKKLFPQFQWRPYIDRLAGTGRLRMLLDAGSTTQTVTASWAKELEEFSVVRKKYLLY